MGLVVTIKNDDDNHINVEDEHTRYAATDDGGDDDDPTILTTKTMIRKR